MGSLKWELVRGQLEETDDKLAFVKVNDCTFSFSSCFNRGLLKMLKWKRTLQTETQRKFIKSNKTKL